MEKSIEAYEMEIRALSQYIRRDLSMMDLEIFNQDDKMVIDSREVAKKVDRSHSALMKSIRSYVDYLAEGEIDLGDFFIKSSYTDINNQQRPCYLLTKMGCDMVANKLTGKKGVLFTAAYVTQFEKAKEENKQLTEDNRELHKIAVSDEEQAKRQYQADKVKYSWINIRKVLENCTYKNIDDEVAKVMDFHTSDLKKKDRADYDSHRGADKTEYKQMVRDRVYSVLNDIYNTTLDGSLRAIASDVKENVLKDKIGTINRSASKKQTHLTKQYEAIKPPELEDYHMINYHPFSENARNESVIGVDGKPHTANTKAYNSWWHGYPGFEMPRKSDLGVDFNKPIKIHFAYDCLKKFDSTNFDKVVQDKIFKQYNEDDQIAWRRGETMVNKHVDSYKDGKIYFYLENYIDEGDR